jgi:hypothetical protein
MDDITVARLRNSLVGAICSEVEYLAGEGGIPSIHLGPRGLSIFSAWRVARDGAILAGNDSEATARQEVAQLLRGQTVQEVTVRGSFHDLYLRFESGITLETFADSGTYEHWNLVGAANDMIIAGPDSSWAAF